MHIFQFPWKKIQGSLFAFVGQESLPLLWFGTSTTNIHKIAKSANDNLTQDKHQNNNLLRRHAIDWRPGRKLENLGNLKNLGNFFPRFLNPSFRFWLQGKIENSEIRKPGIIFPRFPRFPSFGFANFSFSFLTFFFFFINVFSNLLFYICSYSSTLHCLSYFFIVFAS